MASLDSIVERVKKAAGADFAFVLTKRGKLVTHDAPRDMPEPGRARIVASVKSIAGKARVGVLSMAREELVPYGGAAPIDVYFAVADDGAILSVVMATWANQSPVAEAILDVLPLVGEKPLRRGKDGRKGRESVLPRSAKPQRLGAMAGLLRLSGPVTTAPGLARGPVIQPFTDGDARPRHESIPEIVVGTAALGRESIAAIEHAIPLGVGRGESSPDIQVGLASLGRESLLALEEEARNIPTGSAPDIDVRVSLLGRRTHDEILLAEAEERAEQRATNPYVEAPHDAKRAADAAASSRRGAAPKVSLKLEDADDDVLDAVSPPEVAER